MMLANRAPRTEAEALACFTPGVMALRKRAGDIAKVIDDEVKIWEQERNEALQRQAAKLQGQLDGEAMDVEDAGELVQKVIDASPLLVDADLWMQPAVTPAAKAVLAKQSNLFVQGIRPQLSIDSGDASQQAAKKKRKAASLFALPDSGSQSGGGTADQQLSMAAIQKEFAHALTNVTRRTDAHVDVDGGLVEESSSRFETMQPETVPFVPKGKRTTTPGMPGRYESLFVKSNGEKATRGEAASAQAEAADTTAQDTSEGDADLSADFLSTNPDGSVQVKKSNSDAKRKKKEEKREKKRKAAEEAGQLDVEDEGATPHKKRHSAAGAVPVDGQSGEPKRPHDFAQDSNPLHASYRETAAPSQKEAGAGESKKGEGKRKGAGAGAGADKDGKAGKKSPSKQGPAPRQRNQPSSGNRSSTFSR